MAITRIRNNQVYNSDIDAATKIVPYSITAGLLANSLSYAGNLVIGGNLTVNGTTETLDATNLVIADPLLVLNRNQSGTPSYDVGLVMSRGNQTNTAFVWEEGNKQFQLQYTTETSAGTTLGAINNSGYANLQAYGIKLNNATITTTAVTNFVSGNVSITGGTLDNVTIGATTPNSIVATSVTTSSGGQLIGYLTGAIGANTANTGNFTTVTTGSGQVNGTLTAVSVNAGTIGNASAAFTGATSTLTSTSQAASFTTSGGGQVTGYITGAIGANTANTGNFTSVTTGSAQVNGTLTAVALNAGTIGNTGAALTASTATLTGTANSYGSGQGALQITGGFYAGGDSYIRGNLIVANLTSIGYTSLNVNAPLVYLNADELGGYTYELGFYSQKYDSVNGYNHTGLVRNHLDNSWYLFSNIRSEPSLTVDLGNASIVYDTLKIGNLLALSGNSSTTPTTGALVVTGGAGISGVLNVAGNIYSAATTNSTNTTTGSIVAAGGGGFAGNVHAAQFHVGAITYGDTNTLIYAQSSVNSYNQIISQNSNNGTSASTDFIVSNDQGTASTYYGDFGMNSSGFSGTGSLGAPNNVYLTSTSSDLVLGTTTSNAIRFVINSGAADSVVIDTNGNVVVKTSTTSTSSTTGALTVAGGIGVAGNIYVGSNSYVTTAQNVPSTYTSGIYPYANSGNINLYTVNNANLTVNPNGLVSNLIVNGSSAGGYLNLLTTNGATGQVGIKTAPGAINTGTSFQISSTDSIQIPSGTTGQRPAGVGGMIRYNNQSNQLEFYNAGTSSWSGTGSSFTTVTADAFVGNGSQTAFTLTQATTTNGTIVSINGVIQIPITAYSVTGSTLTFTEAPLSTDVIDARSIVTTATVTSISQANSYIQVTDTGSTTGNASIFIYNQPALISNITGNYLGNGISTLESNVTCTAGSPAIIDSFDTSVYRGAKYVVSVQDYTRYNFQMAEVIMVLGNSNASIQTYGVVAANGTPFCNFYANVSGTTAQLIANSSTTSVAKVSQIYMPL